MISRRGPCSIQATAHPHPANVDVPRSWSGSPAQEIPRLGPDEVRVWVVELDEGIAGRCRCQRRRAGSGAGGALRRRAGAGRAVRPARERRRFARCRAALREILGRLLGEPAGALRFRAAAVGKPELDRGPGVVASLRFNISHSADLAVVAVCRGREVGVDLERLRPITEAERIVASFFSAAESERVRRDRRAGPRRGVPAGLDPQGGRAQRVRRGDLGPVGTARDRIRHLRPDRRGSRRPSPPRGSIAGCSGKPRPGPTSSRHWP